MAKPKKRKYQIKGRVASSATPKESTPSEKILEQTRKDLKRCIDCEAEQRGLMLDDLKFATLDQWPGDIRKERENDVENGPRPCLTVDKYSQYRTQVVNDMRQGKPGINVRPQDDQADVETAKILKGLIRNIEDQSSADIAYMNAGGSAVDIGLGFFRITTEYASDDSFDQEIFIRPVPNTFSVYLAEHLMPDGSDAELGYIAEAMPKAKFEAEYPKAKSQNKDFDGLDSDLLAYWKTEDTITVVEEYRIEKTTRELVYLADGTTITAEDYAAWPKEAGAKPTEKDRRTFIDRQLKWRKMTAVEILDERDLPGKYIPIVEVIGRETFIGGKRVLWGLVRPAKDSLRMYNYWSSTITEKMALAPKTPYIGAVGQFATQTERWKKANRVNYSFLEYDPIDSASGQPLPAPMRQGPTPMEAALLKQMQVIEHDVQTSLGMFKAAVGESESQQSGKAILALQRESDTSTYHFGANLGLSIRHAGRIIVDLIPHYYDTKRIVRILGEDGDVQAVQLDPQQQTSHRSIQTEEGIKHIYNPGVGKYDVSITTGPSYNTKRMEAAATFVELAKGATDPASAAIMRYLTVKNSDFEGADDAAKMLRSLLPPPALASLDSGQPVPPQVQAQMAQMSQQIQVMHEAGNKLADENQQLKSGAAQQQAKIAADHDAKMKELNYERECEQEKAALAREKAVAEFELKKWIAEQEAGLEDARATRELQLAERKLSSEQHHRELETDHKIKMDQAKESETVAPQFMDGMKQMLEVFAQTMASVVQQQEQMNAQLVGALNSDRVSEMTMSDGRKVTAVSKAQKPRTH
jgi:hypothetical protein